MEIQFLHLCRLVAMKAFVKQTSRQFTVAYSHRFAKPKLIPANSRTRGMCCAQPESGVPNKLSKRLCLLLSELHPKRLKPQCVASMVRRVMGQIRGAASFSNWN